MKGKQAQATSWQHNPDFCPGCGLHPAVNDDAHRADCTVERVGWCPCCLAYLPVHGEHRADCTERNQENRR